MMAAFPDEIRHCDRCGAQLYPGYGHDPQSCADYRAGRESMRREADKQVRAKTLDEVVEALERGYHGQNPSRVHPADYITKAFQLDGHEGLDVRVVEPDPQDEAAEALRSIEERRDG